MLLFVLCLFTTSILSIDHGGVFGQSYGGESLTPYDFNDDVNNRNLMIQPNGNFVYNFEQFRRDQPPQVEQRNENIGKYMHRKPKVTTTSPLPPSLDDYPRMEPLPHVPTPIVPNTQWNHVSSFPPTIPPAPSTPKWADLSDLHNINKQSFPHYETPQQTSSFQSNQPSYPSVLPNNYQPYVPAPAPQVPSHPVQNYNQDYNRQVNLAPSHHPVQQHNVPSASPKVSSSRGSHKFSWDDVQSENHRVSTTYAPPTTTVGQRNGTPPASFPTLSPWVDGFGK